MAWRGRPRPLQCSASDEIQRRCYLRCSYHCREVESVLVVIIILPIASPAGRFVDGLDIGVGVAAQRADTLVMPSDHFSCVP